MNNSTDGNKSRLSTWDRIVFFIIIIPLFVFMDVVAEAGKEAADKE